MKKYIIIILLGCLTFNAQVIAIKSKTQPNIEKQKLSGFDKVKVTAAGIGCFLFTWSALFSYPVKRAMDYETKTGTKMDTHLTYYPTAIIMLPFLLMTSPSDISHSEEGQLFRNKIWTGLTGITSGAAALALGFYIYKKLHQPKEKPHKK